MSQPPDPLSGRVSGPPSSSTFLQRRSYRKRRIADAARFLPMAGIILLLIPLLMDRSSDVDLAARTSRVGLYIFGLWAVLIVIAAVLARWLRKDDGATSEDGAEGEPQ